MLRSDVHPSKCCLNILPAHLAHAKVPDLHICVLAPLDAMVHLRSSDHAQHYPFRHMCPLTGRAFKVAGVLHDTPYKALHSAAQARLRIPRGGPPAHLRKHVPHALLVGIVQGAVGDHGPLVHQLRDGHVEAREAAPRARVQLRRQAGRLREQERLQRPLRARRPPRVWRLPEGRLRTYFTSNPYRIRVTTAMRQSRPLKRASTAAALNCFARLQGGKPCGRPPVAEKRRQQFAGVAGLKALACRQRPMFFEQCR